MVQICARNVSMDMSYVMEFVRVSSENFFLSSFSRFFASFFIWKIFFELFFFVYDLLCVLDLFLNNQIIFFISRYPNRSFKRKTRLIRHIDTLLSLLRSLCYRLHNISKFNLARRRVWSYCWSLYFLFWILVEKQSRTKTAIAKNSRYGYGNGIKILESELLMNEIFQNIFFYQRKIRS